MLVDLVEGVLDIETFVRIYLFKSLCDVTDLIMMIELFESV